MTDTMPERRLDIRLELSFPWSNEPGPDPARLRIHDETSGLQLFEFELDGQQVLDLLASRGVRPTINAASHVLEYAGHPMSMWTETFPTVEAAKDFKARLVSLGWRTRDEVTSTRTRYGIKYTVTGRRWDGDQAGTICPTCGWPIPVRFADQCPECVLS